MPVDIKQSLLTRGAILTCSEPGCKSEAIVITRGELPKGWMMTQWWPEAGQEQVIDVFCPEHDPVFDVPTEAL
jgi:hypothetical protein